MINESFFDTHHDGDIFKEMKNDNYNASNEDILPDIETAAWVPSTLWFFMKNIFNNFHFN